MKSLMKWFAYLSRFPAYLSSLQHYAANSATIRAVLALRNVVYSNGGRLTELAARFQQNLRVVVQIEKPCPFLHRADFVNLDGTSCLYIQVAASSFFVISKILVH